MLQEEKDNIVNELSSGFPMSGDLDRAGGAARALPAVGGLGRLAPAGHLQARRAQHSAPQAQTTLIVVGLMLSTLIISAALGTGDTLDYSTTSEVYDGPRSCR